MLDMFPPIISILFMYICAESFISLQKGFNVLRLLILLLNFITMKLSIR